MGAGPPRHISTWKTPVIHPATSPQLPWRAWLGSWSPFVKGTRWHVSVWLVPPSNLPTQAARVASRWAPDPPWAVGQSQVPLVLSRQSWMLGLRAARKQVNRPIPGGQMDARGQSLKASSVPTGRVPLRKTLGPAGKWNRMCAHSPLDLLLFFVSRKTG